MRMTTRVSTRVSTQVRAGLSGAAAGLRRSHRQHVPRHRVAVPIIKHALKRTAIYSKGHAIKHAIKDGTTVAFSILVEGIVDHAMEHMIPDPMKHIIKRSY